MGTAPLDHTQVRSALLDLVGPPRSTSVRLELAEGRTLAADLHATVDVPPFDNAAMDGYAVRGADLDDVPATLRVLGDATAGRPPAFEVTRGEAVRILTGAPVPPGADRVVPVEHTDGGRVSVRVDRCPDPGAHIRRRGEGGRSGDRVLDTGTTLHAGHLSLAASVGAATLEVTAAPRVAVVSTGDELVAPGAPLGPAQIHESDRLAVAALARRAGALVHSEHHDDDPVALRARLARLARDHDLVLTTGGISMGAENDPVRVALEGPRVRVVQLDIRPAKPFAYGRLGDALVVGLPGNPVAAVVSFELFVRPALRAMSGVSPAVPASEQGPAGERFTHPGGGATYFLRVAPGERGWTTTGGGGSHLLAGLAAARALAVLRPGDDVAAGEQLTLLPLWR